MTEHEPYASRTAVAGLAREVESLRRTVTRLAPLPDRLEEVARIVTRLAETVAQQRDIEPDPGTVSWLGMPEDALPADAESVLLGLSRWMNTVYLRYADAARGLPGCWLWHPDVIEELLWLHQSWAAAYRIGEPVSRAADWHDRYRPGVVRRIRDTAGMCSIENHQPGRDRHGTAPPVPLAGAAAVIARWWATDRAGTPPTPTAEQLAAASGPRHRARSRA